MASNKDICERNFRRTMSTCTSNGEFEEATIIGRRKSMSENVYDADFIEKMVTCSIHLGLMDNPKKLKCQHAFCYDCLMSFVKINVTLFCPICRAIEGSNDVSALPTALVEKQLIEVVMQRRISDCMNRSLNHEIPLSKGAKEELVKHLLQDLDETSSSLFKLVTDDDVTIKLPDSRLDSHVIVASPVPSYCSSTYDMMDIEIIRQNMLKYSSYKAVKRHSITRFCPINNMENNCVIAADLSTFDIHVCKEQSRSYEVVFVDSNTNKIFVYSETEFRFFYIRVDGIIVKPVYIRILNDELLLTAIIIEGDQVWSVFLRCNMYGKIVRKSERCQHVYESDLQLPVMCGFDFDVNSQRYFVCTPHSNSIHVYDSSLVECRSCYDFDDHKPEFVTVYPANQHIWISCPSGCKILIADIETGVFMMFGTDQISQAMPRMIYYTDDERVIFLDSRSNRLIWIKRHGDYILPQKLHFRSVKDDLSIKSFQVLPFSLIVVGTANEILVFKQVRMKSRLKLSLPQCALL